MTISQAIAPAVRSEKELFALLEVASTEVFRMMAGSELERTNDARWKGAGFTAMVGLAAAGKLRIRLREEQRQREMVWEGVICILEGMNPRMLRTSLRSFLPESTVEHERAQSARAARA